MAHLIDTNIAIHASDGTDVVLGKLAEHESEMLLSALTLAELQRGIYRDRAFTAIRHARLEVLALLIDVPAGAGLPSARHARQPRISPIAG